MLYVYDDIRSNIIKCNYDGTSPTLLFADKGNHLLYHSTGMAVFQERLFWTEGRNASLLHCNKHNGQYKL